MSKTCDQKNCNAPAHVVYDWLGKPKYSCLPHYEKARLIARELGFFAPVRSYTDEGKTLVNAIEAMVALTEAGDKLK